MHNENDARGIGKNSGSQINNNDRGLLFQSRKGQTKQAQNPQNSRTVFLYDSSNHAPTGWQYFQQYLYANADVIGVNSWPQLTQRLAQYKEIDTLIVCAHGTPGSILINGRGDSLSNEAAFFRNSQLHVTSTIRFESCNIMRNPIDTARLVADICGPGAHVIGYTLFHVSSEEIIDVPQNTTPVQIQALLDRYNWPTGSYLMRGSPNAASLANPGSHAIPIEWFRTVNNPNPPPPRNSPSQLRSINHIMFSSLRPVNVSNCGEATRIRDFYRTATEPRLEEITITNVAAVAGCS
jgi:hypothetical protein